MVFINMQSLSGLWSYNWGKHCSFRNASMYHIITRQKNILQNFQLNFTRSRNSACSQLLASWLLSSQALQQYRRWNNHLHCPQQPSEISCLSALFLRHQNVPGSRCPGAPPCRLQERRLHGGGAEGHWRSGARQPPSIRRRCRASKTRGSGPQMRFVSRQRASGPPILEKLSSCDTI